MSVLRKKPEVVVFAGPNGSGKSTITELLKPPMDYINADEIQKKIKCSEFGGGTVSGETAGRAHRTYGRVLF